MLKLEKPNMQYMSSFIEAVGEGFYAHMAVDHFDKTSVEELQANPEEYLQLLNSKEPRQITIPDDKEVTLHDHEIYWVIEDGKFIGGVSLRYDECDLVDKFCGHVGLSIRDKSQGQGYGIKTIELAMNLMKERSMDSFIISCYPENNISRKLIKRFDGEFLGMSNPFGWNDIELYNVKVKQC